MFNLNKCYGGCKPLVDIITGINEFWLLVQRISSDCKCQFDVRKYNWNQKWYNNKRWCECKSHWYNIYVKKIIYDILVDLLGNLILTCENKTLSNKTTVNTSPYNTGSSYCYYLLLFLIFASSHN